MTCPNCQDKSADDATTCAKRGPALEARPAAPPEPVRISRKAIFACILGVLQLAYMILAIMPPNSLSGVLVGHEWPAFFIFSIVGILALILGLRARLDIRTSEGQLDGAELALIGVVAGAVALFFAAFSLMLVPGF